MTIFHCVAAEDTYVDQSNPSYVAGLESSILTGFVPSGQNRAIVLKFDVSGIAAVSSCALHLKQIPYGSASDTISVHVMMSTLFEWDESTLCSDNWDAPVGFPSFTTLYRPAFDVTLYPTSGSPPRRDIELDITDLMNTYLSAIQAADGIVSIQVNGAGYGTLLFASIQDSETDDHPYLEIDGTPEEPQTTFYPIDDTYTSYENQSTVYGASASLVLGNDDVGHYTDLYLKFDLSAISSIKSGKLYLYLTDVVNEDPVTDTHFTVLLKRVTGTWNEETLTYSNEALTNVKSYSMCPITVNVTGAWVSFDITNLIYEAAGQEFTLYMSGLYLSEFNQYVTFSSKEGTNPPYIEIEPVGDTVYLTVPADNDTYITAEEPDTPKGSETVIYADGSGFYKGAYFGFPLDSLTRPIKSILFKFYVMPQSTAANGGDAYLYAGFLQTGRFDEDVITSNNDAHYWAENTALTLTKGASPVLNSIDVTNLVLNAATWGGVMLNIDSGESTGYYVLGSKEGGYGAYLYIETYEPLTIPTAVTDIPGGHAILRAIEDSHTRNWDDFEPCVHGNLPFSRICKVDANDLSKIFIKFDMTGIPTYSGAGCQVMLLHLPQIPDTGTGTIEMRVHMVTSGTWDEDTLTFNNYGLAYSGGWYADKIIQVETGMADVVITLEWNVPDTDGTLYGVYDNQLTLAIDFNSTQARNVFLASIECGQSPWIEFYWNPEITIFQSEPIDDTYISSAQPTTIYGAATDLVATAGVSEVMLKFDLNEVDSIAYAAICFYVLSYNCTYYYSILGGDWSEETYNWNSADLAVLYQDTVNQGLQPGLHTRNITVPLANVFQTIMDDYAGIFTIRLSAWYGSFTVASKEHATTSYHPYLDFWGAVEYVGNFYVDGSYYFDGYHGNDANPGTEELPWLTLDHAADTASTGSIVHLKGNYLNEPPGNLITPIADSVTYIHWVSLVNLWTINSGSHSSLTITCNCDNTATLQTPDYVNTELAVQSYDPNVPVCAMAFMQFDLSSLVGKEIHTATLSLTAKSAGSGATRVFQRVTSLMFENSVSWNNMPFTTSDSWRSAVLPLVANEPTSYEITAMVADAVRQNAFSFGVAILPHDGSPMEFDELYDREYATATYRPQLTITYVTPS